MIDAIDRLPDDFYNEEELYKLAINIMNPNRYANTSKHIIWYPLYMDGVYTNQAMLLAVESVVDGLEAVNKMVNPIGLEAKIGWYGEESVNSGRKVDMLYHVLEKWNYASKLEFVGDDKLFTYHKWMAELC